MTHRVAMLFLYVFVAGNAAVPTTSKGNSITNVFVISAGFSGCPVSGLERLLECLGSLRISVRGDETWREGHAGTSLGCKSAKGPEEPGSPKPGLQKYRDQYSEYPPPPFEQPRKRGAGDTQARWEAICSCRLPPSRGLDGAAEACGGICYTSSRSMSLHLGSMGRVDVFL